MEIIYFIRQFWKSEVMNSPSLQRQRERFNGDYIQSSVVDHLMDIYDIRILE